MRPDRENPADKADGALGAVGDGAADTLSVAQQHPGRSCPCGCVSTPYFDDPDCRSLLRVHPSHNADNDCVRQFVMHHGGVRLSCKFDCQGSCGQLAGVVAHG